VFPQFAFSLEISRPCLDRWQVASSSLGKQNKILKEKIDGNRNGVNLFFIIYKMEIAFGCCEKWQALGTEEGLLNI